MSKHLQAVIKDCRDLLEKDFTRQCSSTPSQDSGYPVKDASLAFLFELAILRCFEEQIWHSSSQVFACTEESQFLLKFGAAQTALQQALACLQPDFPYSPPIPTFITVKKILYHLRSSIRPEEWRSERILGWCYQHFCENTPEQKQDGQFYTPAPIADYIISQAFNLTFETENGTPYSSLTILDLACGCGAFALKAFERLYAEYQQKNQEEQHLSNISQRILEHQLFLVDNDPWACSLAMVTLYLKAKRHEPDCCIKKMNVVCADALTRWEDDSESTLRIIFAKEYDIVVGNPPYIVINQLQMPKDVISLYKSYQSAAFKINTFALFVERGLELLRSGGILGMIVPNTVLTQLYFEPLRRYILSNSTICSILDTKRMFKSASVENCILLLQREENERLRHTHVTECRVRPAKRTQQRTRVVLKGPEAVEITVKIPQRHFEKAPFNMFNVHLDEHTFFLLEKIANGNPRLGDICESHDGVNPGNAKEKLIVDKKMDKTCKKVLHGKNIGRYRFAWDGLYVRYNKTLLSKKR